MHGHTNIKTNVLLWFEAVCQRLTRESWKNLRYNTREYRCLMNVVPFSLVIILTRLSLFWEIARCGLVFGCRRFGVAYRNVDLNYTTAVGWNQASCCYRRSCCPHNQGMRPYRRISPTALGSAVPLLLDGTVNEVFNMGSSHSLLL